MKFDSWWYAAGALSIALPCAAQPSPALDRFSLSLGAYSAKPELDATIGSDAGFVRSGEFDGDRKTMPRISGEALLGDRHGLFFDAFRYSQSAADSYAGGYTGGPFGVTGSAALNVGLDLDVARLGYRYWFGSGNTVLGLGAGLGYYRVALQTNAAGALDATLGNIGNVGYNGQYSRTDKDDAIAPMLEVAVRHAFTPDLRLFFEGSGIYKSGGSGVHGSIYNASAGVEWFPVKNLGVSLAYAVSDVDLKRDDAGLQRLRVKFQGPVASMKLRF